MPGDSHGYQEIKKQSPLQTSQPRFRDVLEVAERDPLRC
jgi:hypothetical protein